MDLKFRKSYFLSPYFVLIFLICLGYVYTFFHPIPSMIGGANWSIGLGAKVLEIGDRDVYEGTTVWGLKKAFSVSFFYPLIIKIVTSICNLFGFDSNSKLWNFIMITITSSAAILSLDLIIKSATEYFGKRTANFSGWLFIICPYTILFSLNGGQTMYMILGVSYINFIISKSKLFNDKIGNFEVDKSILLLSLTSLFLSSFRTSGAIFSIVILTMILIKLSYNQENFINLKNNKKLFLILISTIIYSLWQITQTSGLLSYNLVVFSQEGGSFFGIDREIIRNKINISAVSNLEKIKSIFYLFIWKITDFVSGMSDIRNTHSSVNSVEGVKSLFPFLARVFSGIFIIFPINFLSLFGLIVYFKTICRNGLWLVIFASLISLSPSLLGVAMSRYLIMFYPPFLITAGSIISLMERSLVTNDLNLN